MTVQIHNQYHLLTVNLLVGVCLTRIIYRKGTETFAKKPKLAKLLWVFVACLLWQICCVLGAFLEYNL